MGHDWQELTRLVGEGRFEVERVRLLDTGIAIEGAFAPPPLAQLTAEDQVFVAAFVRCHGSIKQKEKYFGVSYPTIKNRLNKIGSQLAFVEIATDPGTEEQPQDATAVLERLSKGEITAAQAIERLKDKRGDRHE